MPEPATPMCVERANSSILAEQNAYQMIVDFGPTLPQTLWKSYRP